MSTIANQLFRATGPGIVIALVAGGLLLHLLIGKRLEDEFDSVLVARARTLAALTEYEEGSIVIERYDLVFPRYADPLGADYFALYSLQGELLLGSETLVQGDWIREPPPSADPQRAFVDVRLPDGRSGRRYTLDFTPEGDYPDVGERVDGVVMSEADIARLKRDDPPPPVSLRVAVTREPLDDLLGSLLLILSLTGLALIAVILLLARRAIDQRLAPLARIGEQAEALDIERLQQRLYLPPSSLEIDRLTRRFNELLDRLDKGFARERRFSADVAHELRTPIAELKALAEVSERFPNDPELVANYARDHAAAIDRMERTVVNLLALSRNDAGQQAIGTPGDLCALLERCIASWQSMIDARRIDVQLVLDHRPSRVAGIDLWQAVLDNLIGNAVEYAPAGTRVDISLTPTSGGESLVLEITNRSDDLEPGDLGLMYARLWRKDESRRSPVHSGLGLSLVEAYLATLGLSVSPRLEGGVLVMRIEGIVQLDPQSAQPGEPAVAVESSSPASFASSARTATE